MSEELFDLPTKPANRTVLTTLVITLVAAAVAGTASFYFVHNYAHLPTDIDRELAAAAGEMNKNLPMLVDKETRLDSTAAAPNKTLIYHYTLVNFRAADVPKDRLVEKVRPPAVNNYKTNPTMKGLRDGGVTLRYDYADKDGIYVTGFTVSPSDF